LIEQLERNFEIYENFEQQQQHTNIIEEDGVYHTNRNLSPHLSTSDDDEITTDEQAFIGVEADSQDETAVRVIELGDSDEDDEQMHVTPVTVHLDAQQNRPRRSHSSGM
jgi:hypothetical protein